MKKWINGIVLLAMVTMVAGGCKDNSPAGAPAAQPAPVPVASTSSFDQLPAPVQTAFSKDRKDSTIQRIKHRMNPDGVVHYTINSTDPKGVTHVDEYRADGVLMNPAK